MVVMNVRSELSLFGFVVEGEVFVVVLRDHVRADYSFLICNDFFDYECHCVVLEGIRLLDSVSASRQTMHCVSRLFLPKVLDFLTC